MNSATICCTDPGNSSVPNGVYITEDGLGQVIELIVPGFTRDMLSVKVQNRTVIITGVIPQPVKNCIETRIYIARHHDAHISAFTYTAEIPSEYDMDGITAALESGILTVQLPYTSEFIADLETQELAQRELPYRIVAITQEDA